MTKKEHIEIHKKLHESLDQLLADFMDMTGKLPSETSAMELAQWSHRQTIDPDTKPACFTYDPFETPSYSEE